jgi:hypothetical protein
VILVAVVVVALVAVPLAGGRLDALREVRFRAPWLLLLALAIQVALAWFAGPATAWRLAAHVASFAIGLAWVWRNLDVAGLPLAGAGAGLNALAIAANGGIMPASASALRAAGLAVDPGNLPNSGVLANPHLSFLGDVFAIPKGWPLANVFSVGDVVLAVGAAFVIHAACGSRLVPARWRAGPAFRRPARPSARGR